MTHFWNFGLSVDQCTCGGFSVHVHCARLPFAWAAPNLNRVARWNRVCACAHIAVSRASILRLWFGLIQEANATPATPGLTGRRAVATRTHTHTHLNVCGSDLVWLHSRSDKLRQSFEMFFFFLNRSIDWNVQIEFQSTNAFDSLSDELPASFSKIWRFDKWMKPLKMNQQIMAPCVPPCS